MNEAGYIAALEAALERDAREKRNEYLEDRSEDGPKPLLLRRLPFGGCFVRNDKHANSRDNRGARDADPLGLGDASTAIGAEEQSSGGGSREGRHERS